MINVFLTVLVSCIEAVETQAKVFMQNLRPLLLEFDSTAKNIYQWIEEYKEMPPEVLD